MSPSPQSQHSVDVTTSATVIFSKEKEKKVNDILQRERTSTLKVLLPDVYIAIHK